MVKFENLFDNENMKEVVRRGNIRVFEYQKDLSVSYERSVTEYYASKMNIKKRQVLIELNGDAFTVSAGAMQWTSGKVSMAADIKGVGDLIGKAFSSKMTKESAIKPKYQGTGLLMLEPTYKHILLEEVSEWDGLVLEDGLFLACDSNIQQSIISRNNLSSAFGGEGLFNLMLKGKGLAVLESPVPRNELFIVNLDSDEIRIDGSFAVAWSSTLSFTMEKSTKSLIGSAVSGEGFVNVYRGTGKILMAPIA